MGVNHEDFPLKGDEPYPTKEPERKQGIKRGTFLQYNDLRQQLQRFSREPFREALEYIMGCAPSKEAVFTFAQEHPDKWAKTIETFAKMAGYHEKLEIEHNIHVDIQAMGDAELEQRLLEIKEKDIVDITPDDRETITSGGQTKKEAPEGTY